MQNSKRLISFLVALLIAGIAVSFVLIASQKSYTVENFTNKSEADVKEWAKKNSIPSDMIIYAYDYSDDVSKGNVISQSVKAGTELDKNQHLTVRISNGVDPDKKVLMTDFKGQKLDQIKKWFTDNGFTKVTYNTEIHDDMEEGSFVSVTPAAGTAVEINSQITVVTSIKSPPQPETITFPDFDGQTQAEVEAWGNENNIYIRVIPEYSATIESGYFITADVSAGTEIDPGSTVRVYIAS